MKLIRNFLSNSKGSVFIFFGLAGFTLVIAVGVGVEMARYSIARTKMQYALDLSVISAAAVRETQDVHQVANDFFRANYDSDYMDTIFTSSGVGGPVVVTEEELVIEGRQKYSLTGRVSGTIRTYMGTFVTIEEDPNFRMAINQVAQAIQTYARGVEIVLTVDNSTSMCKMPTGDSELPNMIDDPTCAKHQAVKNATLNFVDTLYEDGTEGIYVGVVPFNHNIRMPNRHPLLYANDWNVWHTNTMPSHLTGKVPPPPLPDIRGLSDDYPAIRNALNSITIAPKTWGFTRTNIGTLTAALMLMPYAEDRNYFDHASADLPHDFHPGRIDKVLILLTDGENVTHFLNKHDKNKDNDVPVISTIDNLHQAQVCELAKTHYGITIFTVTYDLPGDEDDPTTIKNIFKRCASTEKHFFEASDGTELADAYKKIADSLKRIRLYK